VFLHTPNGASIWQVPAPGHSESWRHAGAAQLLLGHSELLLQVAPTFGPPLHAFVLQMNGVASTAQQMPPGHSESCWQLAPPFVPPMQLPRRLQSLHATLFHVGELSMSSTQSTTSCTPPCVSV